jgi:hypothetical protein
MSPIIDGYCTLGVDRETQLTPAKLLEQMNDAGIAQAVIVPVDREIVIDNQTGNQRINALASISQGRFIAACSINPWCSDGCDLLNEAVTGGARMLVLAPALQGFIPTDELTDPLLKRAGKLNLPVYFHTGPHSAGGPTQVVLLAEQYPNTTFILGHCGTTDHAWDMRAIFDHHQLDNLWYESSFVRPTQIHTYPTERMIFGTASPRNNQVFELQHCEHVLPVDQHPQFYGGNLTALIEQVNDV